MEPRPGAGPEEDQSGPRAKGWNQDRPGAGQEGTQAGRRGEWTWPKRCAATQKGRGGAGRGLGLGPPLTLLAGGWRCAPGQVPLAGENVGAEQLVARLALVSKHCASDQVPVGSRPPAPLRRWQLGARVVPRDLCRGETASLEAVRLRAPFLLLGSLACRPPAPLGTLDLGTFEVQHETLAKARVWGPGRCLELQGEVGPS